MDAYRKAQNLSLIIQPGDSFFPMVDAIDSAQQEIKMTIFRMDDPIVRDAMSYAVDRGVKVQALVAPSSKGWNKKNKKLAEELTELGVEVRTPKAGREKLKRYHYKMMMIDDKASLILTFNPTQQNLHYARDFGLLIRDPDITIELSRLFDSDWQGTNFKPKDLPLVISPDNSRAKLIELLESATHTIRIMDGKVEDKQVLALLLRKASAGCSVKMISSDDYYDQIVPSLHVKLLARFRLHAKCVVIDGLRFFVGSQNLRRVSLDGRREVGMIAEDAAMAQRIERVFDDDWNNAAEMAAVNELKTT